MKTLNTNKAIGKCMLVMLQVLESLEKMFENSSKKTHFITLRAKRAKFFFEFSRQKLKFLSFLARKIQVFQKIKRH